MNLLRFDSVGGASGDMILGALCALGADPAQIEKALRGLAIGEFSMRAAPQSDRGIAGLRLTVDIPHHDGRGHHARRTFADIRTLIGASALPPRVKNLSLRAFERLAAAEGRVHGGPPEQVHFHEVGAVDSIVDTVGACMALDALGVDAVQVGPLPVGHGTIQCAHGVLPNPAPATADLLQGHPLVPADEPFELVTPTGAALLMTWKDALPAPAADAPLTIGAIGSGLGQRRLNTRANLLRALLMIAAPAGAPSDECLVIECNLDDTSPEIVGGLTRTLLQKGALDVFTTAVQMKKQRPGTLLTVLCHPQQREPLVECIFTESTTFGVREHLTRRTRLDRRIAEVETAYGKVRVKIGTWKGRDVTRSPEYDDCARCAGAAGVPVRTVFEAALRALA